MTLEIEGPPDCGTPEPRRLYVTAAEQGQLVEEISDLLDNALHLEGCYIGPDETHCVCVIGVLRAVLPQCGYVETFNRIRSDGVLTDTRSCLRTEHPTAPYQHVFGEA